MQTAPRGVHFLAKTKTFAFVEHGRPPHQSGYKIVEAYWDYEDNRYRKWCGQEGTKSTEPFAPVGWWPLPDIAESVDLSSIPEDWWLYGLFHQHTPIRFRGEVHLTMNPTDHGQEPWKVSLQHRTGGKLTHGQGPTPKDALRAAVMEVELRWGEPEEER